MREDKAEKEDGVKCGQNRILSRYGARKPLAETCMNGENRVVCHVWVCMYTCVEDDSGGYIRLSKKETWTKMTQRSSRGPGLTVVWTGIFRFWGNEKNALWEIGNLGASVDANNSRRLPQKQGVVVACSIGRGGVSEE